jgi:hypothetical protein
MSSFQEAAVRALEEQRRFNEKEAARIERQEKQLAAREAANLLKGKGKGKGKRARSPAGGGGDDGDEGDAGDAGEGEGEEDGDSDATEINWDTAGVAAKPLGALQFEVIRFLKSRPSRTEWVTPQLLLAETGIDLNLRPDLVALLSKHARVEATELGMRFVPRRKAEGKADLIDILTAEKYGVPKAELVESYLEAAGHLKELVEEGRAVEISGERDKNNVRVFGLDPTDLVMGPTITGAWQAIEKVPFIEVRRQLVEMGIKPASAPIITNSTSKYVRSAAATRKQRRHNVPKVVKFKSNQHLAQGPK